MCRSLVQAWFLWLSAKPSTAPPDFSDTHWPASRTDSMNTAERKTSISMDPLKSEGNALYADV